MAIYQRDNFVVHATGKNYVIHNTNFDFHKAHTHIKSFQMCKTIINNVLHRKKPHTKNTYILDSHIRLTNDQKYINLIEHLKQKAKDKQTYTNVGGRRAGKY